VVRRSVADDSYGRGPFTRSIELDEVEALPRAELDLCVAYRERHAVADKYRFDVRRAVAFGMRVFRVARDHALECGQKVLLHIGVRVLVHEYRGGRVRDGHGDDAVAHLRARHRRLHPRRDVDGLLPHRRRNGDLLVAHGHACASAASRRAAILAMSAGVAFPPLITRTVRRPRGSTLRARTAASGAAPDGSTRSDRASRYS